MLEKKKIQIKCPTCQKLSQWNDNPYRPFCSQRCSLIDLGKWADNNYQIEGNEPSPKIDETTCF